LYFTAYTINNQERVGIWVLILNSYFYLFLLGDQGGYRIGIN